MKSLNIMKTQSQIAELAKVSPGAISNILNGRRRPSWTMAKRLAGATGTTPELWLDGSPDEIRQKMGNNKNEDDNEI